MRSAVSSGKSGWAGGLYLPNDPPPNIGGVRFNNPGTASSIPPVVPSSNIIEARNNRGSNVRIPCVCRSNPVGEDRLQNMETDCRHVDSTTRTPPGTLVSFPHNNKGGQTEMVATDKHSSTRACTPVSLHGFWAVVVTPTK